MKTWVVGSALAVAGLIGSAGTASAGGFGIYVGTYPSAPSYPVYGAPHVTAYSAPQMVYSAPQVVYQPAPVSYAPATVYAPTPTYAPQAFPSAGLDRYRARVRYRPLRGDFVYRYRGRATW